MGLLGLHAALRMDALPSYDAIRNGEYDLIAVHYKLPYVYGGFGNENPWINEICEQTNTYSILVNEEVAKAKGIRDGDEVWLESPVNKVRGSRLNRLSASILTW